jgi:hypothetical protein
MHSRIGKFSKGMERAQPELSNQNINNSSVIHATRCRMVVTEECHNWQITCTEN